VKHNVNVFPNPTSGILNLDGEAIANGTFVTEVFDARGRMVHTSRNERVIDLSGFENGFYVLRIDSEVSGVSSQRIVISK